MGISGRLSLSLSVNQRRHGQAVHEQHQQGLDRDLAAGGIQHFSLYELRHTFATRLSAAGVADRFVSQALRQDDPAVFKRYSQAKLQMLLQALGQLDRRANERVESFGTATQN